MQHNAADFPNQGVIPLFNLDADPPQAAHATPAMLTVNGQPIAPQRIAAEMQHFPGDQFESSWQQAARALIIRELLLQQARRLALDAIPQAEPQGGIETEEDALIRTLIEHEVPPC